MRTIRFWFLVVICVFSTLFAQAGGKARHVVVIVWDGMRPDFITEENSPTLFQLAHQGVWFDNHHPVYISATEVNGTAIATGAYPADDGVIANTDYRPEIDPLKPIHSEDFAAVRKGDAAMHGHYISVPTVAEIIRRKGMKTAIAGAKPIALLHDRTERPPGAESINLFAGKTLPPEALTEITNQQGAFPSGGKVSRNDWTTTALIDSLWKNGVPQFSVLWMNEPDSAQHGTGPGSAKSLAAIKNADENLARVLRALEAKDVRDQTDILLVSDHGFSTILSTVDLADSLRNAGIAATRQFKTPPTKGEVMVVGDGGSVLIYVIGHERAVIDRVVKFLQGWSYSGVILTRERMEGTFTLAQARVNSAGAPDVMVSLRWTAAKSDTGAPGMLVSDLSGYSPGQGMHGSLSRFDMHNTFIAAGPDFRSGVVDRLPTGNVDIAPTVLWILGVSRPKSMDGRVVTEALSGATAKLDSYAPNRLEAMRELVGATWHQYLNFSEVNGTVYFDEGNGWQTPK